jgi:Prealbumin-like fold domain
MSLGTFRQRPVRRRWLFGITTTAMVTFIALFVTSALGVLPGSPSNFEADDGDMIVTTAGNNDWASVAFTRVDDAESVTTDDSFQPGQKQDTTCPVVEGHKNPPKDDFTDAAEFSETNATTGDVYLYGATIRVAPNGNASENVELNQGTNGTCPGSTLLARAAGDKLIAIDYVSGGPDFNVLTWVTSGTCFVSNDLPPCWGPPVALNPADTEGAVNASAIPAGAATNPINGAALEAGQFAEFGVNLTATGIIPRGSCKSFTQTVFQSRSSGSSFVSTVKDITISHRNINVCPNLIVRKVGSDGGSQAGAVFTLYSGSGTGGPVVGTCTINADGNCVNDAAGSAFPPSFANLSPGTYTLDETTVPSGYLKDPSMPQTFTLAAGETKTITATDIKLANVIVKKVGSDGGSQAGAVFTLYSGSGTGGPVVGTCTINADGNCVNDAAGSTFPPSFANLSPGTYTLDETTVPSGYAKDPSMPQTFTLAQNETKTITATDIRLVGAIVILKKSTKTGSPLVSTAGAVFSYDGSSVTDNGANDQDPAIGSICVSGLATGSYTVNETTPPPGYGAASESNLVAEAVTGTNCNTNLPTGSGVVTFTNPPLADIQVNFRDGGSGETSLAEPLACDNPSGSSSTAPAPGWGSSLTVTGIQAGSTTITITCTIKIDP